MLQFNDIHSHVIRTKPTEHFSGVWTGIYIANLDFDDLIVAAGGVMRIVHINKIFKDGIFSTTKKKKGGSVVHVREEVKLWQL